MNYFIYCKKRGSKERFGALDLASGSYGVNLLYATFFRDLDRAKAVVDDLTKEVPDIVFQVRKPGCSKPVYEPSSETESTKK